MSSTLDYPLWVEIDLGAVKANVRALKGLVASGTQFLAVVKANGYGHGDVEVASAAIEGGAGWLGVARVSEGERLRQAGISHPILLLAEPPPAAIPRAVELELVPTIYTREAAQAFSAAASRTLGVHVKVDTGMHRYGVAPTDVGKFLAEVGSLDHLEVAGLWSHFAVAEDVLNPFTKQQLERFLDVVESLGSQTGGWLVHLANSAAVLTLPEAHQDMVRAGIAVYGIYPSPELSDRAELQPALSFKSRVGQVKRLNAGEAISYGQTYTLAAAANVVTVPCGYADGLRRSLSNRGEVLIGGNRYSISGTITMDHFLVDVGDDEVAVGDEVVLLGEQAGEAITAQEIAETLDTIPYEVTCAISARVPRVYLREGE